MIQSYALATSEIDDADLAVADIAGQVAALPLLANSVGIVACHYDYVNGGIIEALSRALPFPLIGITTFYQVTPKTRGLFELSITLLTSDDVRFALAGSDSVRQAQEPSQLVADTYLRAYAQFQEPPAAILSFLSAKRPISGDSYLRVVDELSGGVPNFGAVSTGDDEIGTNVHVICEDSAMSDGFAVLLLIGDVKATYHFCNYREEKLLQKISTVTEAEDTVVKKLNGEPAVSYLRKNGIPLDESEGQMVSHIPFLCRFPGEERLIGRTLGSFDAQGQLHFFAEIPENALFRVGTVSMEDILDTSLETVYRALKAQPKPALLLAFSCVGRYITLGLNSSSELEYIADAIPGSIPYLTCYGGGEICPVDESGGLVNHYHNASMVVCALS